MGVYSDMAVVFFHPKLLTESVPLIHDMLSKNNFRMSDDLEIGYDSKDENGKWREDKKCISVEEALYCLVNDGDTINIDYIFTWTNTVSFYKNKEKTHLTHLKISVHSSCFADEYNLETYIMPAYRQLGKDLHENLQAARTIMRHGLIEYQNFKWQEELLRLKQGIVLFQDGLNLVDLLSTERF
jgi:hypothetical protein